MPLLTTLGASTAKAFFFRGERVWYDNGVPAQGPVFNLQGDSSYHNYADGVDLGVYTGPIYLNNLWKRVLFGSLMGDAHPAPDLALVSGQYDLGEGLKWYYRGEIADGYIQNLATREIYGDVFTDFFTPVSTLAGWRSFDQGTDDDTISGEHNVDGQGNLWYVDGDFANGIFDMTPDNLWHTFSTGIDQGLVNDFDPATANSAQLNETQTFASGDRLLLVFQGAPFTGNFLDLVNSGFWRQDLGQYRPCSPGAAFSFVDGVCTGALTGEHTVVNAEFQNTPILFRDGQNMHFGSTVIRSVDGSLRSYWTWGQYETITDSDVYVGFLANEANMQLLCDTTEPTEKAYLVLDGQLAQAGCRTLAYDVYCIGADGLIEGWDQYNLFNNPEPNCANCIPYYF